MRLIRRSTVRRSLRLRGERGSTMIAVVGITVVTAVVAVGITGVTMGALATTGNSRSAIQAQAAADSGISAAVAALNTGVCASSYTRSTTPAYTVQVAWSTSATAGFANGCPTITSASYLRLTSTGTAATATAGGLGATRYIEAVFQYTPETTTPTPTPPAGIVPSGGALYSYQTSSFGMTGLTLNQAGTVRPTVILTKGKFNCDSSSVINGDVIAAGGDLTISNCTIKGNVSASGWVELTGSGKVTGTVSASGLNGSGFSFEATSPSGSVGGSVLTAGPGKVQIPIGGDYIAAGSTSGTSTFENASHVNGSVRVSGNLIASGMGACDWNTNRPETNAGAKCIMQKAPKHVDGDVTYQTSGLTAPAAPTAPGWVDYNYKAADWTGYNVVTLASGDECNWSWKEGPGIKKLTDAAKSPTPTVIDARVCDLSFWASVNPVINANMVVVAKSFNMGSNTFTSKDNVARKMWFITPDTVADGVPTCSGGVGNMGLNGSFNVSGSITAMAYTPCTIDQSSTTWRGQMYAGYVKMNSNQTVNYDPIGLPGVNLDTVGASSGTGSGSGSGSGSGTGTPTTNGTGVVSLPAISYRDVSSAG